VNDNRQVRDMMQAGRPLEGGGYPLGGPLPVPGGGPGGPFRRVSPAFFGAHISLVAPNWVPARVLHTDTNVRDALARDGAANVRGSRGVRISQGARNFPRGASEGVPRGVGAQG